MSSSDSRTDNPALQAYAASLTEWRKSTPAGEVEAAAVSLVRALENLFDGLPLDAEPRSRKAGPVAEQKEIEEAKLFSERAHAAIKEAFINTMAPNYATPYQTGFIQAYVYKEALLADDYRQSEKSKTSAHEDLVKSLSRVRYTRVTMRLEQYVLAYVEAVKSCDQKPEAARGNLDRPVFPKYALAS